MMDMGFAIVIIIIVFSINNINIVLHTHAQNRPWLSTSLD